MDQAELLCAGLWTLNHAHRIEIGGCPVWAPRPRTLRGSAVGLDIMSSSLRRTRKKKATYDCGSQHWQQSWWIIPRTSFERTQELSKLEFRLSV